MEFLIILLFGVFSILFGQFGKKSHREFVSKSIVVDGTVVGSEEVTYQSRDRSGSLHTKTYEAPVVEYECGGKYQFVAESNMEKTGMARGSQVDVYVKMNNPRIAKLKMEDENRLLMMNVFVIVGVVLIVIGIKQFLSSDYKADLYNVLIALISIVGVFAYLYFKFEPAIRAYKSGRTYQENAKPVGETIETKGVSTL